MRIIHYAVVAVLVLGMLYYFWVKPPSLNPIADRRSAEALALVQTHRDQGTTGQWFEREFIWHADLALKKVNAASLPADGVTPKDPDAAP